MNIARPSERTTHSRKTECGVAAIEFALLAPLLLLMLVALVEIGLTCYQAMQVQSAAEAGALYAAKYGWDAAGIQAAVVNATAATGLTATPAPLTYCGCPQATGITTASCGSTCTGGSAPGQYVEVHASVTHLMILPYPGIPSPLVLQGTSIQRLN
jgi:Flp pilus assembly protein TadG